MVKALQIDSYIGAFINGEHAGCHVGFKMKRSFLKSTLSKIVKIVYVITDNSQIGIYHAPNRA